MKAQRNPKRGFFYKLCCCCSSRSHSMETFFVQDAAVTSLCPYDARPPSVMSKRVYRLPPFYTLPVPLKAHCTHALTHTRLSYTCSYASLSLNLFPV
ncbi:hypothetical protein ACTXT7_012957 [Hymenolepis weldensis]